MNTKRYNISFIEIIMMYRAMDRKGYFKLNTINHIKAVAPKRLSVGVDQ